MKLATIEKITSCVPHPNADKLDIVGVLGYKCIVARDTWRVGDLCVLIQPDTVLPNAEWATFYGGGGKRVRAIRLRGEWSFGIVEKLSLIGEGITTVGTDVSGILGVTKYEPKLGDQSGAIGGLPFGIPKTNEERYQNLTTIPYGKKVLVTQKIDGESATYYCKDGVFGVCSRNLEYSLDSKNSYTAHVDRYELREKLTNYCKKYGINIALRGENYGLGIQTSKYNPHSKCDNQIAFFSVWLIDEMRYVSPWEHHGLLAICRELNLPTVRILEDTVLTADLIDYYVNLDRLDDYFEGVVMVGANFSFKVINLNYDQKK